VAFRRRRWRDLRPDEDKVRINQAIRVPEVRVINEEGQQLGIMPSDAARDIAMRVGLDLVEIAPSAQPPVCKIMDYGRYKYEIKKKASSAKKAQHRTQVKEIKFRPRIEQHDLEFKLAAARRFLMAGDKVRCTVVFRGREIIHAKAGVQLLERVSERLADIAKLDQEARLENRQMGLILTPDRAAVDRIKQLERKAEEREAAEEAPEEEKGAEA
jgi:translation initiation factor IF-3